MLAKIDDAGSCTSRLFAIAPMMDGVSCLKNALNF